MGRGYIYLIRNLVNGKGYVGQTIKKVKYRFRAHIWDAQCGSNLVLHRAIRKYGESNFSIQEVCYADVLLLDDLEKHYIKFFGTFIREHGYNMTEGGDGGSGPRSQETRAKISAYQKGRKKAPLTAEHKAAISKATKGKKKPATEKMLTRLRAYAETKKGVPRPKEVVTKISASLRGKPWTAARRLAQESRKK